MSFSALSAQSARLMAMEKMTEKQIKREKLFDRLLLIGVVLCLLFIVVTLVLGAMHVIDIRVNTGEPFSSYLLNKYVFGTAQ